MYIQLKQKEIEKAITRYLATQGITVTDKTITLAFTSGRKGNGLSVEVRIEDQQIEATTATIEAKEATAEPVDEFEPVEADEESVADPEVKTSTTSLFGN